MNSLRGLTPLAIRHEGRTIYCLARVRHRGEHLALVDANGKTLARVLRVNAEVLDLETWCERYTADCDHFTQMRN